MVVTTHTESQRSSSADGTVPGDEIVITGISGSFPNSDSVKELGENLFTKVDLISDDDRRWKLNHPDIPQRSGKINNISKFDASFFGLNSKHAHATDSNCRILLEKVYEAIIDAGVNPDELRNTKTGVFIGSSVSEAQKTLLYEKLLVNDYGIIGCSHAMLAHRVSSWLGLTGPSYVVDTACSSSLYAFEHAYKAILRGQCDAAIVGCTNLCTHPCVTLQFYLMGVLSSDGTCRSFDDDGAGYVRSETIAACFLQRAKDSRRVYAQMVYAKTNCDGYTERSISYPSGGVQKVLLQKFYEECGVSPTTVEYVEAHATGTKVGDPEEMAAIDEVFCTGRSEPLLIGGIKSNLGHAEPSSGMCSIAKMCVAYNTGFIPPNINFKKPRKGIKALEEGRAQVITDKHPWNRGLAGINNFGFGGANAHTLLKNFSREKINNGLPSDDLPRLVCVSGRTEAAVDKILNDLLSRTVDVEEVRLWHSIHTRNISGHPVRGYVLLGSTPTGSVSLSRDVQYCSRSTRAVWVKYTGFNNLTPSIVKELMKITIFAASVQKCHNALEPKGINLIKIITDPYEDNLLHSLLATTSAHIGFTDVLKTVGIQPDHISSQDVGKFACAYADGILTAEQVILAAFSVGLASTATPINTDPELLKYLTDVMLSLEAHAERWSSEAYSNAIVVEIAPSDRTWNQNQNIVCVALTQNNGNPIEVLFAALGKLYELGLNLQLANLYPEVSFPVSRGTPMLSHLVEWQHCDDWFVKKFSLITPIYTTERVVKLSLEDERLEYISGHVIDGRIVVPATCYLVLVWETLALYLDHPYTELSVVFDNVSLLRLTYMPTKGTIELTITIHWKSGNFELMENGTAVVKGRICAKENIGKEFRVIPPAVDTDPDDDIMIDSKDVYKERHLRGYNYRDAFCGVISQSVSGSKSSLAWINNWVTFLDTLVQVVPDNDSRNLRVPLRIDRIAIDVDLHNAALSRNTSEEKSLDLRFYPEVGTIRCGGVEVRGLHVATISRKPPNGIPVYEKSEFISNYSTTKMAIEDIIRADIQLVHENIQTYKFKTIELVDEEYETYKLEPLIEKVADVLADLPLVQAELVVLSEKPLELPEQITVLDKKISGETNTIVFIGANLLHRPNVLHQALDTLKEGCFVISQEVTRPNPKDFPGYSIVTINNTGNENIVLLRIKPNVEPTKFIKIVTADQTYAWIDKVKNELNDGQKLVLYSQGESVNGLLGLVNCLRKEPGGETVSGVLIADPKAPEFNPECKFYKEQLDKDLGINVYMNGEWGTYRHLILEEPQPVQRNHAFLNVTTIGDLSSLRWSEGSLNDDQGKTLVHVYNAALNFRDVMTSLGRVTKDSVARGRIAQECVMGLEVVGRSAKVHLTNIRGLHSNINPVHQHLETVKPHLFCLTETQIATPSDVAYLNYPGYSLEHKFRKRAGVCVYVRDDICCRRLRCFEDSGFSALWLLVDAGVEKSYMIQRKCLDSLNLLTNSGSRVMALAQKSISNIVEGERTLMWPIPDEWSFEEAATVPVVYSTAYVALIMIGEMKRGESILIHSGAGGVGQAAINVALHYGCEVFTTVGSPEKRAFIQRLFPQIKGSHIGNSRDLSFEDMIKRETNGKGVNLVLNALSDDKLLASTRCLSHRGRFLEMGKYDITNNTLINLYLFKKEVSFHSIMLDYLYGDESLKMKKALQNLMLAGIQSGAVRPIIYTTFGVQEIESPFRFMAAGKHIGKIIIKIREEDKGLVKPKLLPIPAVPRYTCDEKHVYVLVGGLGGFGLELADWLILRGAKKLILNSRRGISNGYQRTRLRAWKSEGADVKISTHDTTTESGSEELLEMGNSIGQVSAIFNLAVVLKDAVFTNQTPETFKDSFGPKAQATINLDKLSRQVCPQLRDFVIFSSVSCGRGNAGQTNYGFSNSVMERICEERKKVGLPALAIQWGAIGDVGLVADMQKSNIQLEIGGTLQQKISSCLQAMDRLLMQDATIVSSIVVAEKNSGISSTSNAVEAVAQILGISDLKTVSKQAALTELGLDSIMAVEIKQTLEREFEIFLTAQEIRNLTFAGLHELTAQTETPTTTSSSGPTAPGQAGLGILLRNFGDEHLAYKPFIHLPSKASVETKDNTEDNAKDTLFLLPGLESSATALATICSHLNVPTCALQLGLEHENDNLADMADRLYKIVQPRLAPGAPFRLLGYSFGTLPILELAGKLENEGHIGVVICLDGSPDFNFNMTASILKDIDDREIENTLIVKIINFVAPNSNAVELLKDQLTNTTSAFEERIASAVKLSRVELKYSLKFLTALGMACFDRLKCIQNHKSISQKLKSPIVLLRQKEPPYLVCEENYGLNKCTESSVTVYKFDDDHMTILDNVECANIINKFLSEFDEGRIASTLSRRLGN